MNIHANDTLTKSSDFCLADCATTHTILKDKLYFTSLVIKETNVRIW
jgi:hypothetical protein